MSQKTALVTGGAGLIGHNLCLRLLSEGWKVVCLDAFLTSKKDHIRDLLQGSNFTLIEADIIHYPLSELPKIDKIFHLACPASPPLYQQNPIHTLDTCYLGTQNCLEFAKANDTPIFIASTSEVYGSPTVHPQPESYWGSVNPLGPRACYNEGKRVVESLASAYAESHGLKVKIARIFNTYGPHMQCEDGRVISNFITQALRGNPLTIYGDGSQTRSFCYVSDLIDGIMALVSDTDLGSQPVNLGNNEEWKIETVAREVIRLTDSTSEVQHLPLPEDDPIQRQPDLTRAKQALDWQPTISLEAGLQKTIDYFAKALATQS